MSTRARTEASASERTPAATMSTVVITGAAGAVGRRVLGLVLSDPSVERVVAIDIRPVPPGPRLETLNVDLLTADLGAILHGADVLVHLASSSRSETDETLARRINVDATARLMAAAAAGEVTQVIGLSSAMAYGAWASNPVPLTEEAPLRPNPEFAYAVQQAQREHLLVQWRQDEPNRAMAVLRPVMALAEGEASYGARLLAAAAAVRAGDSESPAQFVTFDDVAAAVEVARRQRLDGAFNVSPDGWIPAETVRALTGSPPRLPLPSRLASRIANWSWELQLGPIPPGLLPYTMHPWVVSNDRMKAAGWAPTSSNEEAYVAGTEGTWWSMMSPKRKQELALGASGAVLLVSGAAVGWLVRRASRQRH
jgi:nucleoside-diphosphate-sugar epimerase